MDQAKSFNRMSIEHILCSPYDGHNTHHYGLPSPASSYYSSDDDDYTCSSREKTPSSIVFTQNTWQHLSTCSDKRINMYQQHRRAILPYRRRRRGVSNADSDLTNSGQKRVPWLPEEDTLLKQGFEQGLSWAMIASTYLPHRSRGCCWGRFKTLKNKKFLNVRRQIRVQAKPWKTLNPLDMQASL